MMSDRKARGRRVLGHGRMRNYLLAAAAVIAVAAPAPLASGASGGVSTAPHAKAKPKHAAIQSSGSPFSGRGMWIWILGSSNGGNLGSIISRAHRNGVTTLMIKSGDGASSWSQFSPQLVSTLHANGLRVCAWQYVYGAHPVGEARVSAAAVRDGADCFLIDAEGEYEQNKYVQAQTYIRTLRQLVGANFPVALAGFPYVDYHPAFPYSVFLGPGGAQFNVPQMYWFDIGTSVNNVYAHTYVFNRLYQRPISPLGQVYNSPPASDIRRFRQLSRAYAAPGVSWWDWQEAPGGAWHAISQPVGTLSSSTADTSLARLGSGAQGDLVVWAQEHLVSAGQSVAIDGAFGPSTKRAVQRFQTADGLPAIGSIGPATWQALLRYAPARVTWTSRGARIASAAVAGGLTPVPKSATLPAKRDEIAGAGGAGRPKR